MWEQNYTPVAGSLGFSTLVAAIPLVILFYMLGVRRKPGWVAGLSALGVAAVLSLALYGIPAPQAAASMVYGAAFGLFPIGWIVVASLILYRVTLDTGKFEIIKDSIGALSDDRRLQAVLIGFAFGAFIEGAAGFGTPVAIAAAMLTGLGFPPFYAAFICLLANTAPVAFGSLGIPVVTLAGVTGLPEMALSAMTGRLCALIALIIPAYMVVRHVGLLAGARGRPTDHRLLADLCRRPVWRDEHARAGPGGHPGLDCGAGGHGPGDEGLAAVADLPARR